VSRLSSKRPGRPVRYVCVEVIRDLHGQGYSFREIARTYGIGYGTVRRAFHGLAPAGAQVVAERPPASCEYCEMPASGTSYS
jgi:transposase-like protein